MKLSQNFSRLTLLRGDSTEEKIPSLIHENLSLFLLISKFHLVLTPLL